MEAPSRRGYLPGDMLKVGRLARGPSSSSREVTDGEAIEKEDAEGIDWEGEERERDLGAGGVMEMEEAGEEGGGKDTAGDALEVRERDLGTLGVVVAVVIVVVVSFSEAKVLIMGEVEEEGPMAEREEVSELG
ncbi:hypothetical protein Pmani_024065 [Petrolisthes manimaculis]|uniref:Uncharacterized protein n=1 Tax=Petrolisthes manimaculis TaxID=1843537 RepID=A0AAE1P8Y9_9EUCA|nr:hypothetical protein Pmani_024065 [Petrolisthes manimaculis]